MRILQADKFFYNRGGSSKVFFDTINGLRERGHEVIEFSMIDPKNYPSEYAAYFAPQLPELKGDMSILEKWKIFRHLFRSKEVEKRLCALVLATEPEVAHLHNIYHQLSVSTFATFKKMNIPMVMTVHDVFPLCPNHSLLKGETLGEKYFKNKLYNCVRYRCIDNKLLPSIAGTLEAYYYRLKKVWDTIEYFICPSDFMANKMVEYGFPEKKMRVIKNPFVVQETALPLGNNVVYLGRIHYEKGIKVFLRACKELREYPIIIAGSGPEDAWVNQFIAENRLLNIDRRGWVSGDSWLQVMRQAKVVVVPSVFLENCSLTILEAVSYGRLVVATDRGGNPELLLNGKAGILCKAEDPGDLARAIKEAMALPKAQAEEMIIEGRINVKRNYNPTQYFDKLIALYKEVLS